LELQRNDDEPAQGQAGTVTPWQPTHPAGHGGREATPLRRGAAPCCVQSYRAKDEGGAMLTYHPDGERAIVFSVAMALFAVILRRSSHDHSKERA
jgi:hypothetical protein